MEFNLPEEERKILKFWKDSQIFQKTLKKTKKRPPFVFYEGPPTLNASPGLHHGLSRVFKDVICRFKTMQGFYVERKAGWDTHGLPIELQIEREIKVKSKKDIEKYGIEKFTKKCRELVLKYKSEWEEMTERVGFWLDMENPYVTLTPSYIETLFWIIKQFWEKGYLYEDLKVVPWCPRCQTSLSSHEVALGYKRIKEKAIYVKFKIKSGQKIKGKGVKDNTYFIVWTTTPWTLPGNVAIAVNPKFLYARVKKGSEYFILVKEKLNILKEYKIIEEIEGKDLINLEYEFLFDFLKPDKKSYYLLPGDFVSLKEGTGLVHIAPAFGEEDMELAKKNNLPFLETIDDKGCFIAKIKPWAGKFVKDADPLIIEDLKKRNLLLKEEIFEHDYPFCWRCETPLLYYLHSCWFIATSKIKEKLLEQNQKINWIPSHIKEGRFGNFLKEAHDWNFSRERYWGTPLPIFRCEKCAHTEVIGSREDLRSKKFTTNSYFIIRHGLAQTNVRQIASQSREKYPMTKIGELQIKRAAEKLKKRKIDVIFSSDVLRSLQTAQIIAKELNLKVKIAPEIREIGYGIFDGKFLAKYHAFFRSPEEKFYKKPKGGESWSEVMMRMYNFLKKIDKRYKNKNILIVSHDLPISLLFAATKGLLPEEILEYRRENKVWHGKIQKLDFRIFPYNRKGELDFHRPYIDEVEFLCPKCKNKMKRVKEVCDVWFDSGAMPFAQYHWPFENKDLVDKGIQYPADYIAEAIDQTRGWFYTLLTISTLIGKGTSYKNVICLGHVLDEKGEKMSKSKGNVVKPMEVIEEYGADALRWYFFTANQAGRPKRFKREDVRKCLRRFVLTFWNCVLFWKEYCPNFKLRTYNLKLKNVLDRWIISKLNNLIEKVTFHLESFDVVSGAREIEKFVIEDFSKWYIRCSRSRFQRPKNSQELKRASRVLGYLFFELSRLCAPFLPFFSEKIYHEIEKEGSVHLEDFPKVKSEFEDKELEGKMQKLREIVKIGLRERKRAKIKVRQPLQKLKIKDGKLKTQEELLVLIKDELNVKEIVFDSKIRKEVELDTKITPELQEEGLVREIIRVLQEMRKEGKLKKKDEIEINFDAPEKLERTIEKNKRLIKKIVIASKIKKIKNPPYLVEKKTILEGEKLLLAIKKI